MSKLMKLMRMSKLMNNIFKRNKDPAPPILISDDDSLIGLSTYRVHLEPDNQHLIICVKRTSGGKNIATFLVSQQNVLQQLQVPENKQVFKSINLFFKDATLEHWVIRGTNPGKYQYIYDDELKGSQYHDKNVLQDLLSDPDKGVV